MAQLSREAPQTFHPPFKRSRKARRTPPHPLPGIENSGYFGSSPWCCKTFGEGAEGGCVDPTPYILKNRNHRLTRFFFFNNNKKKKYHLCTSCVSTVCFFLVLTMYPKMKGLSYLHFAEGKTEAKELPNAVPHHVPPSVPLGRRWLPGHVALLVFPPSLCPANQPGPQAGLLENGGWRGEWRGAAHLEGPRYKRGPFCKTNQRPPRAGMGHPGTPQPDNCSRPGSCHPRARPKPDLLLIWLQVCLPGLLHEVQEVSVAVSGHHSVPRGTA